MKLKKLFTSASFFALLLLAFLSSGCEKSANTTVYEWSATIDGVNYSYSMSSYPSSDGGNVMFQIQQNSGGLSLCDNNTYPTINVVGLPTSPGSYTFSSQSSVSNGFILLQSSNLSDPNNAYTSVAGNAQITVNITSVGAVGGIVEGNFSGTLGNQSTTPPFNISYKNVSGNFKAYRER